MKKILIFSIFALNLIAFNANAQWQTTGTVPTVNQIAPANNVVVGPIPTSPTKFYVNNTATSTTTLSIDNNYVPSGPTGFQTGINFNLSGSTLYQMYYNTFPGCGSGIFHISSTSTNGAGIHLNSGGISFSNSPLGGMCGNGFAIGKYIFDGSIGTSGSVNIGYNTQVSGQGLPSGSYTLANYGQSYFNGLSTFNGGLASTTGTFSTSLQVGTTTTPAPFVLYGALSSSSQTIGYAPGTALPSGMLLGVNGGVAIGLASTTKINTGTTKYNLAVGGGIITDGVTVLLQSSWADYVFAKDYKLMSLGEVKAYIEKNKHLPEVPTATEINEKGVEAGEMLNIHMKKIEELTLYMIQLKEENEALKKRIEAIEQK